MFDARASNCFATFEQMRTIFRGFVDENKKIKNALKIIASNFWRATEMRHALKHLQ